MATMPERRERASTELRAVIIIPDFISHAEGSVLIQCGNTRVVCTASVEDKTPPFRRGTGKGWVTSEYGMLPRATATRTIREVSKGRASGRTHEIQRLIGRSLRAVVDLQVLGERTIWVDCDVIEADGGTRTAAITGSFVALALAVDRLRKTKVLSAPPLLDYVGAVSVGIVDGEPRVDLNYEEDSSAQVDMNIVMTGRELFVEVQGTAEAQPFSREELDLLLGLGRSGIRRLIQKQQAVLVERVGELSALFRSESTGNVATAFGNP
jgi:ribonuclease PH